MASPDFSKSARERTEANEMLNDAHQWGEAILRAKTTLIKPHSKYTLQGLRPRTPNEPYTVLTKEQISHIDRTASPLFFDESRAPKPTGTFRHFRQRHADSVPMSHLRTGRSVGGGTAYTFIAPQAYSARLPERYSGSGEGAFPKWYPNRAGERTSEQLRASLPAERFVSIDMYRGPPTARSGGILFDHGRSNDGYYLPRNGYETTWFGSNIELNRRHILDSIQPKTMAEYEQAKAKQQEQYRKAGEKWPFISEYAEQFVLGTTAEQRQPTELERAKQHIGHDRTGRTSLHNQLAASAVVQGRTLINEPSLTVKC